MTETAPEPEAPAVGLSDHDLLVEIRDLLAEILASLPADLAQG